ncbi:MAG TPA: head GIN domain-containing protein [Bacteroidales bacterium]
MKRIIILSAFILAIAVSESFASDQSVVKESRDVSGFTKVSFGVAGNLYINFGPEFKVVLEGEKRYLEEIITEVSGGKLVIKDENWKMHNWRINMNERVTVYITMPELNALGVSGSGKAEIKDVVKTGDLNLSVSGSGKIYTTDITVSNLGCSISGSGDIVMGGSGTSSKAEISISGSGNYMGEPLKIGSAEIHISGSGNCTCYVTESLRASVSGSGNVSYEGNPRLDAHVSGSGKVRSR